MATLPKIDFTASETCDSLGIKMTETTGMYTMPGNTGGWGAPNVGLGMAINAEIYVTVPDGTIYTLTMIPDFAGFLPSQVNGSFIIHMGLLGGTANTTMTQGLYSIRYRVLVIYGDEPEQSTWIQVQKYVFLSSTIKCCVHKMLATLDMCDTCPCDSEKSKALEAYTLYKALLYANQCGNVDSAVKIHDQVTRLCNYTDGPCNTCS
tara:strand:- start:50045 stop:50662 length:618 start_codon:yes stop_codon:yes gene_type:complete